MRVVLDTNVIVSATLVRGGNEDQVLGAWAGGDFELVLSWQILEEIARVLCYPKIQKARRLNEEEVALLVQSLAAESFLVPGRIGVKVCRDPDDDKFLAAALEGEALYVVSGDKDLLALNPYRNIQIVSPAAFLPILRKSGKR